MTKEEKLILRGIHVLMRASFAPNDPERQAKHFVALRDDIGPWFTDYAMIMSGEVNPDPTSGADKG